MHQNRFLASWVTRKCRCPPQDRDSFDSGTCLGTRRCTPSFSNAFQFRIATEVTPAALLRHILGFFCCQECPTKVRDHHVPARHDHVFPCTTDNLPSRTYVTSTCWLTKLTAMMRCDHNAVQPDADRRICSVEPRVIELRSDNASASFPGAVAGSSCEPTFARWWRCRPVMKLVWPLRRKSHRRVAIRGWGQIQPQTLESRLLQRPAIEAPNRVDANSIAHASWLVKDHFRMNLRNIQQIILVADARKLVLLLLGRQSRK